MQVTREMTVSGLHAAANYEEGKYVPTGEVSVHFSVESEPNFHGPGSTTNAQITLPKDEAMEWSVGQPVTVTFEAILERG